MQVTRDVYTGVGPDNTDVRLYQRERDGLQLPSVTSILKSRKEDLSNLHDWQDEHDGEGDSAFHKHWFWYSRHRGTIAHFRALQRIDPDLEWSSDEAQSIWALGNVDKQNDPEKYPEVHDASPREVLYSIVKYLGEVETWGEFYDRYPPYKQHQFYNNAIIDRNSRDVQWFVETFEHVTSTLGITLDNAIEVERYLFDEEYGYAGQCDLLYKDTFGRSVLADLKTKKGAYLKEKLQGAAYAAAVERDPTIPVDEVDRTEVWCLHPDTGKFAIYSEEEASPIHTTAYWDKSWNEHWDQFEELLEDYEYSEPDNDGA